MNLDIDKYDSGLSNEKHNQLALRFNPFAETVQGLIATAKTVQVTGPDDVKAIALARKTRLSLKNIRVDVEKTRKTLKEESLREGKAIDGMANIIKYLIVPVEEELQEKEDYVKRLEEQRIADLVETRGAQLRKLEIDIEHFDLGNMTDQAYASLLSTSEAGYKAKKKAEEDERKRIEAERLAAAQAEAEQKKKAEEERKRIEAENAKLKAAAEEAAKQRAAEEAARRKAEQALENERRRIEAEKRKEAEEKAAREKAAKEAELERLRQEKAIEQAKLAAPDKEKLADLVESICKLNMPSVSSDVGLKAIRDVRGTLNAAVKALRVAIAELNK